MIQPIGKEHSSFSKILYLFLLTLIPSLTVGVPLYKPEFGNAKFEYLAFETFIIEYQR